MSGPRNRSTSAALPTAAIAPSRTATASAQGLAGSPVQMRLTLTIELGLAVALPAAGAAGKPGVCVRVHHEIAALDERHAVHEQMLQPRREARRLLERRRIAERRRVEDDDVGEWPRRAGCPGREVPGSRRAGPSTNGPPASSVMILSSRA